MDILSFDQITADSADLVGGKALSLALTAGAGLPVPPGFCVTSAAYRRHSIPTIDGELSDVLVSAYRGLGGGVVAVRSSATAEDGAATSFAGQQETILGVEGEDLLRAAVERCWRSLHTERAKAYRQRQGVDEASVAMAVVVQRLVDADVAGVMFTRDPLDPTGTLMRIEASWGLGETVVSGKVTPDRFQIERESGRVRERQPGLKHVYVSRHGEAAVAPDRQHVLCLTDEQLAALADLGRRVEAFYGDPRDIEWAIADGRVWLLQARPITTAGAGDREQVRRETIDRLSKLVESGGTVWSRTNLVEVLPEPTPMTWATVTRYLLSGVGGTGVMYSDFGFRPDPAMAAESAYDLIGGRPFLNLSREPRLEDANPVAHYPLASYKSNPYLALDPKREEPRGLRKWLRLFGLLRIAGKITSASKSFADEFRKTHIPAFAAEVERASVEDLTKLDPPALINRLQHWIDLTLVQFARQSLKPTLLAQFSWQVLEQQIGKSLGPEQARSILAALSQGAKSDPDADLPGAIRSLAAGTISREEFLRRFGHRGPNEMELSSPRWSENAKSLAKLAGSVPPHSPPSTADVLARVAAEAKWNSMLAKSMAGHVERIQTYLGLRETGKHHLMRGYAIIRQTLVEMDRRFGLDGGIYYLTPEELPALAAGKELKPLSAERRKRRAIELSLEVPPVLFGDDLDAIGRPLPPPSGAEELIGVPLSAGVTEGPALVLTEPSAVGVEPGYILVCPSTDPAWVPLFVNARGLVMESGGTLSHGAIVAREFGLPAVAGLPEVQHRVKTGQKLRVDGGRGTVVVLS
jgi:pyruvate,water dikinase